jgi:hypothetical protein
MAFIPACQGVVQKKIAPALILRGKSGNCYGKTAGGAAGAAGRAFCRVRRALEMNLPRRRRLNLTSQYAGREVLPAYRELSSMTLETLPPRTGRPHCAARPQGKRAAFFRAFPIEPQVRANRILGKALETRACSHSAKRDTNGA